MKLINKIFLFCLIAVFASCVGADYGQAEQPGEHPEKCFVSFMVGEEQKANVEVEYGACVEPLPDESVSGINGWYREIDGYYSKYNFDTPVVEDIVLYGFLKSEGIFTVTYHFLKEEVKDYSIQVIEGQPAAILEMNIAGDEIVEWCTDADCTLPYDGSVLTADIDLFAKWESSVVPENPELLVFECEDFTLLSGAEVEDHETASGGKAVNIRDKGSLKMTVNIPEDGAYKLSVKYLTWSNVNLGTSKINKISINPNIFSSDIDFKAYDEFTDMDLGVFDLKKGTIEISISYSWGWTIFDKITLKRTVPLVKVEAEFEDGILSDGAYSEEPVDGASGGKAVTLGSSGKVSVKLTVPKTRTYKVIVRYFGWAGQNKKNFLEIPGLLPRQEFTFTGTNGYLDLECGEYALEAGREIQVTASSSWGWTYFDKVSIVEVQQTEE